MWKILFNFSCIIKFSLSWELSKLTTPEVSNPLGLLWDDVTQSLYFCNFNTQIDSQPCIFRYSHRDGTFYSAYIKGVTSPAFIIPLNKVITKCNRCDQQYFAVGTKDQVYLVKWNGKSTRATIIRSIFEIQIDNATQWCGGNPDGKGRFYGGTNARRFCNAVPSYSVYRYDRKHHLDRLFNGTNSTVGIVFNEHEGKMYHVDTCGLMLTQFDWDPETGDICNGRVLNNFAKQDRFSAPHGLDIDASGMLYTALYSDEVWKINPRTGEVMDVYKLPVRGCSGVAFGGPNRDILFVTTQSKVIDNRSLEYVAEIIDDTSIYMITGLNATGMPYSRRLDITKFNEKPDHKRSCDAQKSYSF